MLICVLLSTNNKKTRDETNASSRVESIINFSVEGKR